MDIEQNSLLPAEEQPDKSEEKSLSADTVMVRPGSRTLSKPESTEKFLSEIEKQKTTRSTPDEAASLRPQPGRQELRVMAPAGEIPREIPVRLGRYLIDGQIGRGGMGIVYKARQDGLGRVVALKLLLQGEHASAEGRSRFEREARSIAKLRHPNIVSVHEIGEYEGRPFFTMDYVEGLTLSRLVKKVPIESQKKIAGLCIEIADAVQYAHEQGVIHRDLKPDNILMTVDGKPIITDFGLAKDMESMTMLSMTGEVMGTPGFMSPEQALGKACETDRRSDIYALGSILYWLLTRHEPFEGQSMVETLTRVATEDPPVATRMNPSIHGDLCAICLKAMDRNKLLRYQTAREFADDLRRFLRGYSVRARPWSWHRAVSRFMLRRKWAMAATAAAVAAVIAASAISVMMFTRTYLEIAGKRLTSADPVVRAQTVQDLGMEAVKPDELRAEDVPKALALLTAMHSDADERVITAWLEFMAEHGNEQGVQKAIGPDAAGKLIQFADGAGTPAQRNLALSAVGKIRRPDFCDYLIRRIADPNLPLRMLIVRSLGDQCSQRALGPLVNVVSSDPVCRAEARAALEKLYKDGHIVPYGGYDKTVKTSIRHLTDAVSSHNSRLEDSINRLDGKETPDGPFAVYEEALRSENPDARIKAVYELGKTGDQLAIPLIAAALDDPDRNVGAAAAMAISQIDSEGRLDTLMSGLASTSPVRRGNAALALGLIRKKDCMDSLLVALVNEKNLYAKRRIIQGLGEMGLGTAIPGLEDAARRDPDVQPDVDAALKQLR